MNQKYNAQNIKRIAVDEEVILYKILQKENAQKVYKKEVPETYIQFHFCLQGKGQLSYGPRYSRDVNEENALLLYNPNLQLPIDLTLTGPTKYVILLIGIRVFHSYFSKVAGLIPFLIEENKQNKFYADKILNPSELLVLNQLINEPAQHTIASLYSKAKVYELLSLYFSQNEVDSQRCPFLSTEANVEKIRQAKRIIIEHMADPPSLGELAMAVGLSLTKLKEGFKHIYGDSVFNFLLDYKLEFARKLLISSDRNVSEISLELGYSTASHFIAAFKKKYGTTPKQYSKSLL